jgi:hypothetical protein
MSPRRRRRPAGPPALLIDRLIRSYDAWLGLAAQAGFWTDAQGRLATQILNDWRAIT